ncbi:uncharacterized protein K489DRAFT_88382 [Dissoconium aciculare CBS 342.82]|uniref:Uncharacterized protein n=1 Tax=Dissoconium aciculare CBS 342.82 TaxID=1314786 RepID=A0A6J3LSB3_9PEZI|nr:uncharacterized protein K489DRAFT_88382 [Dissoconium aciculare CBS 342.82]KAF1818690.1 hypothetical protein K489DRAFT_88382 [Dissoconium aciculare CBS 342.82]
MVSASTPSYTCAWCTTPCFLTGHVNFAVWNRHVIARRCLYTSHHPMRHRRSACELPTAVVERCTVRNRRGPLRRRQRRRLTGSRGSVTCATWNALRLHLIDGILYRDSDGDNDDDDDDDDEGDTYLGTSGRCSILPGCAQVLHSSRKRWLVKQRRADTGKSSK